MTALSSPSRSEPRRVEEDEDPQAEAARRVYALRPRRERGVAPAAEPARVSNVCFDFAPSQLAEVLDSPEIAALVSALEATRWTGRPGYRSVRWSGWRSPSRLRRPDVDSPCGAGFRTRGPARRDHRCYPRHAVRLRLLPVYNQASEVRRHAGAVHRRCDRLPARTDARAWPRRRYRRLRHGRLRQRPAVRLQERPGARALQRSGRLLGPPLRRVDAQGRRVLRLQDRRARLHRDRPASRVGRADRPRQRVDPRAAADRHRPRARVRHRDGRARQGLRRDPGVRGTQRPAHHPAPRDAGRQAWRSQAADVRARRMDVRRSALQARRYQVALPHGRAQTRLNVDQGRPAAPADPPRDARWTTLYRRRAAVEREFGRLKHEWALSPLRVRGIERVRLHADLTILAKLAFALFRARAVPLAA